MLAGNPNMTSNAPITLRRNRVLLAFAVTPFLPGFYGALLFGQPWAFPIGLAVAYPVALLLGVPLLLMMRRANRLQWWWFLAAGVTCATPVLIGYAWLNDVPHLESFSAINALIVLAWGAFSGACFWLIGMAGETPLRIRDIFDAGPPAG
jgi:hypothetical protein